MSLLRTSFTIQELINSITDLPQNHLVRTYGFLTDIDLFRNEAKLIEDKVELKVLLDFLDPHSIPQENSTLVQLGGIILIQDVCIKATWIRVMGDVNLVLYKKALNQLWETLEKEKNMR